MTENGWVRSRIARWGVVVLGLAPLLAGGAARAVPAQPNDPGFPLQWNLQMIGAPAVRDAFDLKKEKADAIERYGKFCESFLQARRLVEAGVPFVSVHQEIFGRNGHSYDMHENNFSMLREFNLPLLDQCIPALVQDLDSRALEVTNRGRLEMKNRLDLSL